MIDAVESLILDLLEWVASGERSYEEVMDAWRTSCPRLPVWEDANDRGLVTREYVNGRCIVRVTSSGRRPSRTASEVQLARVGDARLASRAAFDAADEEKLLAPPLQFRFNPRNVLRRDHQNHPHAEVERF